MKINFQHIEKRMNNTNIFSKLKMDFSNNTYVIILVIGLNV